MMESASCWTGDHCNDEPRPLLTRASLAGLLQYYEAKLAARLDEPPQLRRSTTRTVPDRQTPVPAE
jgi:hypothetical protein